MARIIPPSAPNFSGANYLLAKASEQIGSGLNQGVNTFRNFNTNLSQRATNAGLNNIRNIDSKAEFAYTPQPNTLYANQNTLRTAYENRGNELDTEAYQTGKQSLMRNMGDLTEQQLNRELFNLNAANNKQNYASDLESFTGVRNNAGKLTASQGIEAEKARRETDRATQDVQANLGNIKSNLMDRMGINQTLVAMANDPNDATSEEYRNYVAQYEDTTEFKIKDVLAAFKTKDIIPNLAELSYITSQAIGDSNWYNWGDEPKLRNIKALVNRYASEKALNQQGISAFETEFLPFQRQAEDRINAYQTQFNAFNTQMGNNNLKRVLAGANITPIVWQGLTNAQKKTVSEALGVTGVVQDVPSADTAIDTDAVSILTDEVKKANPNDSRNSRMVQPAEPYVDLNPVLTRREQRQKAKTNAAKEAILGVESAIESTTPIAETVDNRVSISSNTLFKPGDALGDRARRLRTAQQANREAITPVTSAEQVINNSLDNEVLADTLFNPDDALGARARRMRTMQQENRARLNTLPEAVKTNTVDLVEEEVIEEPVEVKSVSAKVIQAASEKPITSAQLEKAEQTFGPLAFETFGNLRDGSFTYADLEREYEIASNSNLTPRVQAKLDTMMQQIREVLL